MNKIYYLIALLVTPILVSAQTQQGYVKTKGRLASNGTVISGIRLSGATVTVKGSNSVVSGNKGTFSLAIPNNNFYLQNVQKQGYVLTDPDVLERQYAYSKNPLVLVLETPEEQWEEKMMIRDKIITTLQKQHANDLAKIKALKEKDGLTQEEYMKQMQELYEKQENDDKLVGKMAESYSKMDFDDVDEFNRRFSSLILEGKLTEADSLLRKRGDINSLGKALRNLEEQHRQEERKTEELHRQKETRQKERNRKEECKTRDDIALLCYNHFTIFNLRHQNDSAAYYLEYRANLDTTNIDWLNDAGWYLTEYIADYDKAKFYLTRALQVAIRQKGEQSIEAATCINNLGAICSKRSDYNQALEYYEKSLQIRLNQLDSIHPDVAIAYEQMGAILFRMSDYDRAMDFCLKALKTAHQAGNSPEEIASIYNNIACIYSDLDDSPKAIDYYQKALNQYQKSYENKDNSNIATIYSNIGLEYYNSGEYDLAWKNYNKALTIETNLFSDNHPSLIITYINISYCFKRKFDTAIAIQYLEKALDIAKNVFGEKNLTTATCYGHLGELYDFMKDKEKALEYTLRATKIREELNTNDHPDLATSYNNLGSIYDTMGNDSLALSYYKKALEMRKKIYGEEHSLVASSYNNIGMFYANRKRYTEALQNLHKSLSINKTILPPKHPAILIYQTSIIMIEYHQALDNHKEKEFLHDKVFTASVVADDTPAGSQGLSGKYILLEFADWTQDSPKSLSEKNDELRGQPKDIVVLKDGIITRHHFENIIGMQFGLEYVGVKEKERVNKLYFEWKQQ